MECQLGVLNVLAKIMLKFLIKVVRKNHRGNLKPHVLLWAKDTVLHKSCFTKFDVKHFLQSKLRVVSVPCFFNSIGGPAAERNRSQSWLVGVKQKSSVCP